jgi:hypothetical protein
MIRLDDINAFQLQQIIDHGEWGQKLGCEWAEEEWQVRVESDQGVVKGFTSMDNFDMREFLEKIHVPADKIEWDDGYCGSIWWEEEGFSEEDIDWLEKNDED